MLPTLCCLTAGLALVLLLRKAAQRLFGAGPAFTLWLLPPALAALPWLPAPPSSWSLTPALLVMPPTESLVQQAGAAAQELGWPWVLWMTGSLLFLARLAACYWRLRHQTDQLPECLWHALRPELTGFDRRRLRLHVTGPAVLWAPRSLLLLPADFLERFDAGERQLILQHERMHLRRGDPLWSLLAELVFALCWFHPLVWLALPRLRLDQELACDERVLSASPHQAARYARTLLRSTRVTSTPVLIPWLDPPQLKERLNMIRRQRVNALRRRIGYPALVAVIAACAVTVQAGTLAQAPGGASADLSFNSQLQPHYPKASIIHKEEGTVVLKVLVNPQGTVEAVDYDPRTSTTTSASLISAASTAAFQWHFKPAIKDGKPIESYDLVPVKFSLQKLPDTTSGQSIKKADSEGSKKL